MSFLWKDFFQPVISASPKAHVGAFSIAPLPTKAPGAADQTRLGSIPSLNTETHFFNAYREREMLWISLSNTEHRGISRWNEQPTLLSLISDVMHMMMGAEMRNRSPILGPNECHQSWLQSFAASSTLAKFFYPYYLHNTYHLRSGHKLGSAYKPLPSVFYTYALAIYYIRYLFTTSTIPTQFSHNT